MALVAPYRKSKTASAIWQLSTTLALYVGGWVACVFAFQYSFWLSLLCAIPTGGFMIRIFVLQHDCGHGSFFPSKKWNEFVGKCLGALTFTPYEFWRKMHAIHHATSGDLDGRGYGDVYTHTVSEYEAMTPWQKRKYWLYRNPLVMFGIFPLLLFLVQFRFAYIKERRLRKDHWSVYRTNICLAIWITALCFLIGWQAFLAIMIPVMWVASTGGIWLFYVQHQYEETYWRENAEWDYFDASIQGSSFLRLPKPLQWLTANIVVHHVHHLCPGIPNYMLQRAHDENPEMQEAKNLGIREALGTAFLALWDEDTKQLISFRENPRRRPARATVSAS